MVLWFGIRVMGTTGTSSVTGCLLDLSWSTILLIALGAVSLGVVTGNPGTEMGSMDYRW